MAQPLDDLEVGQTIDVQGSGAKPYRIKNCGPGGYSCTCPAWRNQNIDPASRTCKHIMALRGEEAEVARIGNVADLPTRKPQGEAKAAPPVMLADSWDGETNVAGWWMSEKLDGVRAWWDGKRFLSRNGNLFLAPDWFVAGLPSVTLDGELWVARKKFNLAQGIAMSQAGGEDWRQMRFVVFDVPDHGGEFEARQRFLREVLSRNGPQFASPLEQQQCRDVDHLLEEQVRIETLGGEGLMLRQPASRYVANRSSMMLKVKRFSDAEAVVIGHDPGQGRHKGRLGALVCRLPDGTVFNVGTGFSDRQREEPPPVGSLITFKCQELTPYGTPRFPVFVGMRLEAAGAAALAPAPAPAKKKAPATMPAPAVVVAAPDEVRRCHYKEGGEVRFWEASRSGTTVRTTFGIVGNKQSSKEKTHESIAAAREALADAVAEKLDDGFVEVDATLQPPAAATPTAAVAGGKRRFELVDGASSKFWEIELAGNKHLVTYGRIGSAGTTKEKTFADEAAARRDCDKLIGEKTDKGYRETT